jgi:hypothetical protein
MLKKATVFIDERRSNQVNPNCFVKAINRAHELSEEFIFISSGMNLRTRKSSSALNCFSDTENKDYFNSEFVSMCVSASRLELLISFSDELVPCITVTLFSKRIKVSLRMTCHLLKSGCVQEKIIMPTDRTS